MDSIKEVGFSFLEFIARYFNSAHKRRVTTDVAPGYLLELVPQHAPEEGESWSEILEDIERTLMPGVVHWTSPHFHGYFPAGNSTGSMMAGLLTDAIGGPQISWKAMPVYTELQIATCDWLVDLLGLPTHFKHSSAVGGGTFYANSSEATFFAMLIARTRHIGANMENLDMLPKLVAYTSAEAHSSVHKAAMMSCVQLRLLPTDKSFSLRGETLRKAIREDLAAGLVPFLVVATFGTTTSCSFDNLAEISEVIGPLKLWLHVDAAYAGAAFVCPEHRGYLHGVERVDSFAFSLHKWMLLNNGCAAMWFKDGHEPNGAFKATSPYVEDARTHGVDFKNWRVNFSQPGRCVRVWFTLRWYGRQGLQAHVRAQIEVAKHFESLLKRDARFQVMLPATMALVCFRINKDETENKRIFENVDREGKILLSHSILKGQFVFRFCVCHEKTNKQHSEFAYQVLCSHVKKAPINGNLAVKENGFDPRDS